MLKINNNFKRYRIPLVAGGVAIGGVFLFQYLTFIPEYSSAETISTPVMGEAKPDTRTLSDITNMQEMTSGICGRSAIGEEKQLIDSRDGKTYWIAKLKDDNCWMTQNLDYDDPYSNKTTSSGGVNGGPDAYNASNINTWHNDRSVREYWDPGEKIVKGKSLESATADTDRRLLVGNYYSWASVTNGTGVNITSTNNSDYPMNATSSICAEGWRLPTGDSKGEFRTLVNEGKSVWTNYKDTSINGYWLGGTTPTASGAAFFAANGRVSSGNLHEAGNYGFYWSSTASAAMTAYNLAIHDQIVSPANANIYRFYGMSVRCVARDDIPDGEIQDTLIPNPNVSVTVNPILTLEVADKEVEITPKTDGIATGEFTAKVSSNGGYDIQLNAAENSSTSLINTKDGVTIAEIQASDTVQQGVNGWGIKCIESEDCAINSYTGLTEYNNPKIYFTRQAGGINIPTKFQVGIGIASDLPSGTYSTNILVTASQK